MTATPGIGPDGPPAHECIHAGDPRYDGFRVTDLWVVLLVDPRDNQEGIAYYGGLPLIAADERRLDDMKPLVDLLAKTTGRTSRIAHLQVVDSQNVTP